MLPSRLFKYIPRRFALTVLNEGVLLFRSLSYFQYVEDSARGDVHEGMHVDHPDGDITLTIPARGLIIKGNFAYLNETNAEDIYCFCLSTQFGEEMFDEFLCDCCIEIYDVPEFLRRVKKSLGRLKSQKEWEMHHRSVVYYRKNDASADFDIKNPRNLPFFKTDLYTHQAEYRLVVSRSRFFQLKESIIDVMKFNWRQEVEAKLRKEIRFKLGRLDDIARIIGREEVSTTPAEVKPASCIRKIA